MLLPIVLFDVSSLWHRVEWMKWNLKHHGEMLG